MRLENPPNFRMRTERQIESRAHRLALYRSSLLYLLQIELADLVSSCRELKLVSKRESALSLPCSTRSSAA